MVYGLAFVEIVVNDFDAMVECYVCALGFKQGKIDNNEDGRWCQLITPDGQALIALWEPSNPLQKRILQEELALVSFQYLKFKVSIRLLIS